MKKKNNTETIFSIIQDSPYAISHAEISNKLENKCNRVTIYRILDKLFEQGDIHKIVDITGITKYAACHSCETDNHQHNHLHFSCTNCLQVTCLEENEPIIKLPKDYLVSQVNLTISGLCPSCHS